MPHATCHHPRKQTSRTDAHPSRVLNLVKWYCIVLVIHIVTLLPIQRTRITRTHTLSISSFFLSSSLSFLTHKTPSLPPLSKNRKETDTRSRASYTSALCLSSQPPTWRSQFSDGQKRSVRAHPQTRNTQQSAVRPMISRLAFVNIRSQMATRSWGWAGENPISVPR